VPDQTGPYPYTHERMRPVDHQTSPRSRRRPRIAALSLGTVAVAVLAAGCGSGSSSGSVTPRDAPTTTAGSTALTLKVTDGTTTTSTLTCDPAGGDRPGAAAACAALAKNGAKFLPPTSGDLVCTMIFGGDQTAVITGTWQGKAVNSSFSRENGCEIARWDALVPLLPRLARAGAQ
jgi:hypothetical protein